MSYHTFNQTCSIQLHGEKKTRLLTFKTRLKPILFGTGLLYTIRSNDDETVCTTAESMLFATYFELLAFS